MFSKNSGFTLVELLVTLAVGGILLTAGVPSFTTSIKNNRMVTQLNGFAGALNLARSEAVKRGRTVTLCIRNTAGTDCNNSGDWQDGWIVFVDLDSDGAVDTNEMISTREPFDGAQTFVFWTGANNIITYNGHGRATGATGNFNICDDRGVNYAHGIGISSTGRVQNSTVPACS